MKVVVRDSPIHGRGVFAVRRIEAGDVGIEGCRTRLTDDEVRSLPPEERPYVSVVDGQSILMQPPSRFVNHSFNPNARGSEYCDVAVRAIEAGEEVTVDYADEVSGLTLECSCKAANCRGRI
jgi:SET domain-containing protein